MTGSHAESGRHFYRDRDRAVLGGVCAGLAEYLGFNLKVTRLLAFIAFLMAMPIAVIAYLAAVFLIPSVSRGDYGAADDVRTERRSRRKGRREQRRERHRRKKAKNEPDFVVEEQSGIAKEIDNRCKSMDARLAELEKQVTSTRFQIDQELGRL